MADKTGIQWTDSTWNPIVGCSIVSPGCTNCYAMKMAARIETMNPGNHYSGTTKGSKGGAIWTGKIALAPDHILTVPLHWKRPRKIFVNSMGDLFHEDAPTEWIDKVFLIMAMAPQHTFQVLTKRAARMREYLAQFDQRGRYVCSSTRDQIGPDPRDGNRLLLLEEGQDWPLPNVWMGVSTERQEEADERIPLLLQTPAAVRFISAEPLLGPIDLTASRAFKTIWWDTKTPGGRPPQSVGLDWVIVGGESGPGARSMCIDWAQNLVDQGRAERVPVFMKQLGSRPTRRAAGQFSATGSGHDMQEWPEPLRYREFP